MFFAYDLAQARDGRTRDVTGTLELVEIHECDVELADRAQGAREALHDTLELTPARAGCHERQRFAEPARGDPRVVERPHVASLRRGKGTRQRHQALPDQQFGRVRSLHGTVMRLLFADSAPGAPEPHQRSWRATRTLHTTAMTRQALCRYRAQSPRRSKTLIFRPTQPKINSLAVLARLERSHARTDAVASKPGGLRRHFVNFLASCASRPSTSAPTPST